MECGYEASSNFKKDWTEYDLIWFLLLKQERAATPKDAVLFEQFAQSWVTASPKTVLNTDTNLW